MRVFSTIWSMGIVLALAVACVRGGSDDDDTDTDTSDGDADADADGDADTDADTDTDTCETANMDDIDPQDPGEVHTASCAVFLEPPASAWIVRGTLVTPDEVFTDGTLLFDAATHRITCAGTEADCPAPGSANEIDCGPDALVFPGLIDAHNHPTYATLPKMRHPAEVYSRRYEWRGSDLYAEFKSANPSDVCLSMAFAEIQAALGGTTAVESHSTNAACCQGLVRNLLSMANGFDTAPAAICYQLDMADTSGAPDDTCAGDPRVHVHLSEGVDRFSNLEFSMAEWQGYLGSGLAVVHGTALTSFDLGKLAIAGGGLVWSPRSNLNLYHRTADVMTAMRLGVPVALAPDWPPSGSVNLLSELACADSLNAGFYGHGLSDPDLVAMVTRNPAEILGLGQGSPTPIGRLAAGFYADFVIVAGDPTAPHRSLIEATPHEVLGTFVGGAIVAGQQDLVEGIKGASHGCDPVSMEAGDQTFVRYVCLAESGFAATLDQIVAQTLAAYQGLSYGGGIPYYESESDVRRALWKNVPEDATPACFLPTLGDDADRDGVADAADDCPDIWDPEQRDLDGDGSGDPCDECPLSPVPGPCPEGDADHDGVPDGDELVVVDGHPNWSCAVTFGQDSTCGQCLEGATCAMSAADVAELEFPNTYPDNVPVERPIRLDDVIVVGKKGTNGVYVADPEGGPFAGVYVWGPHPPLDLYQPADVTGVVRAYRAGNVLEIAADETGWALGDPLGYNPVPYAPVEVREAAAGGHDAWGLPAGFRYQGTQVRLVDACVKNAYESDGRVQAIWVTPCACAEEPEEAQVSFFLLADEDKPAAGTFSAGEPVSARGILDYYGEMQIYAVTPDDVTPL